MPLTAEKIDDLIDSLYEKKIGSGELRQLSYLFSDAFWKSFENLLTKDFTRSTGPYKQKVEVAIAYIDKIPVADFMPSITDIHGQPITQRTEIGDAAFFFIDVNVSPNGEEHVIFSSGLILQAKEANTEKLPKTIPIVPLPKSKDDSTLKELALLSTWPQFDLYVTGNSTVALQKGYVINNLPVGTIPPHAWYIGAPPQMSSSWVPHWVAGQSAYLAPCDQSLGSLLNAMLEHKGVLSGTTGVGKTFKFDKSRLNPSIDPYRLDNHANPPEWDDLCHQIMLTCKKNELPQSLFGKQIGVGRVVGATLHSNPFGFILKTAWEWLSSLLGKPRKMDKHRKFPVVVVVRKAGESNNF